MAREYGRAPRGKRCYDSRPKNWGENITVIGALSLAGVDAVMTLNGALTQPWFDKWVEKFLVPLLMPGDLIVLDNLSVHKSKRACELVQAAGAAFVFLPAYSPDLNPIEQAWSKLKALLRMLAPRTRDHLEDALVWAISKVSPGDALSWIKHSGYLLDF